MQIRVFVGKLLTQVFCNSGRASMEKEGLASIFKMEDITVMGAAELFPHLFRIWVGIPM